jgi:hypothetical protein
VKTNSSTLGHEVINLGTNENPKNTNLGQICFEWERQAYIKKNYNISGCFHLEIQRPQDLQHSYHPTHYTNEE